MNIPKTEALKTAAIYCASLGYGQRLIRASFVWPMEAASPPLPWQLSQLLSQLGSG